MQATTALRSIVLRYARVSFSIFFLEMSLFPIFFGTISAFSLYGEYVVRSFLPNGGVFLPCDHGLDFFTSAYYVRIQSINQSSQSSGASLCFCCCCCCCCCCFSHSAHWLPTRKNPPGIFLFVDAILPFSGVTFLFPSFLFCFVLVAYYIESAALCSTVLRYGYAPTATRR